LQTLAVIVQEQAGLGDLDEARRTADRLTALARLRPGEDIDAPVVATARAAVGDFEGAFEKLGAIGRTADMAAGKAALAAARYLEPDRARRFVAKAVDRLVRPLSADRKGEGLIDLAEAQALIGNFEGAKSSARSIGEGPTPLDIDTTDGRPYAMILIAIVQREVGHSEAARETLREAYRMVIEHPKMLDSEGRLFDVARQQVSSGDLEGALRSAESMPEWRRAEILAMVARSLAIAGKAEDAGPTIARALTAARSDVTATSEAKPAAVPRMGPFTAAAYSIIKLAEIQAMAGDLAGSQTTLRSIEDERSRKYALERVVAARAASGDVKGALDLAIKEARNDRDRAVALRGLAQGVETRLSLESPSQGR
jgi:hypothetical protein